MLYVASRFYFSFYLFDNNTMVYLVFVKKAISIFLNYKEQF